MIHELTSGALEASASLFFAQALATLANTNRNQNDDLNHQEEIQDRVSGVTGRIHRAVVDVGALPCSRPAVDDAVPLDRLVGEVEDLVADGESEDARAERHEDEAELEGVIEMLCPEIMDVKRNQREEERIEHTKRIVRQRVVAVALWNGHENQKEEHGSALAQR